MAKIISTSHLKSALKAVDDNKMDDYKAMSTTDETNNYPYHRIAKYTLSYPLPFSDSIGVFNISFCGTNRLEGTFVTDCRTEEDEASGGTYRFTARWLFRGGTRALMAADDIRVGVCKKDNVLYADIFLYLHENWRTVYIQSANQMIDRKHKRVWTLVDSCEAKATTAESKGNSYECWKNMDDAAQDLYGRSYDTIYMATDNGIVGEANKVNGHTVETDVPANALFVPSGGKEGQVLLWGPEGVPVWADV